MALTAVPPPVPAPPPFTATVARLGDEQWITFTGELDLAGRDRATVALHDDGSWPVSRVLDLRGVTFIDLTGLRVLLDAVQRAVTTDTRLEILPSAAVTRLLEVCDLRGLAGLRATG